MRIGWRSKYGRVSGGFPYRVDGSLVLCQIKIREPQERVSTHLGAIVSVGVELLQRERAAKVVETLLQGRAVMSLGSWKFSLGCSCRASIVNSTFHDSKTPHQNPAFPHHPYALTHVDGATWP